MLTQRCTRRRLNGAFVPCLLLASSIAGALAGCSRPSETASLPTPAAVSQGVAADSPRRAHLWVLSVGVSHYRDPRFQLRYAAADAQAFAAALRRQQHGPLYDTVHTEVLVDADATRERILDAVESFLGKAAPIDVAVIYVAGHGIRTEKPTAYYFLTAAASPAAPYIAGLDMAELGRQLQRLHRNIPRMVVILDTCHAGAVTEDTDRVHYGVDLASALVPSEGLYILTAAPSGETSFEVANVRHGAFTYALLDGLNGEAADPDGLVSVFSLASHATRVVEKVTQGKQHPYLAMIGEDLVLAGDPDRFAQITPRAAPAHLARAAPPPERERVAIRTFEHVGPDPTYTWMRRALSEDVLTAFSELHQLDVYDENMLQFVTRDASDVIEAAQRAGIAMLVEGAYWVQDKQLSINAEVKSVHPLKLVASAHSQGSVDQFSLLTGQLVMNLLDGLSVEVPTSLSARLLHPSSTSLAARRLLTETEGGTGVSPGVTPHVPSAAIPPDASLQLPGLGLPAGVSVLAWLDPALPSFAADLSAPEADLQETLEGYRAALEGKDLHGLQSYYDDFTDSQSNALSRYFENAVDLRVEFSNVRIAIIGDEAAVSFTRHDLFTDRGTGNPQDVTVRVTKRFAKRAQGWVIRRVP